MSTFLVVALVLAAWCLAPFPLAVAVGRAFRAAEPEQLVETDLDPVYDAAGA